MEDSTEPRLELQYESTANAFYHAGTVQLIKRLSHNYTINANYTSFTSAVPARQLQFGARFNF